MIISDIELPAIEKNATNTLCTIHGDVLLSDVSYSDLTIKDAYFKQTIFSYTPSDGSFEIRICHSDGERYLIGLSQNPGVFVDVKPALNSLKITCYCVDKGRHTLTITDMLGNSSKLHE